MERFGEKFIHEKDTSLHTSEPVEHEVERRKRRGEKVLQKPAEKIFNWMRVLEKTHMSHRDNLDIMEKVKNYYYKEYVIKPEDIPENYFDNQRRIAREQGHGDIEITDEIRRNSAEIIISDQKSTLNKWIEYLSSSETDIHPTWVKYWAFTGMLRLATFDKKEKVFAKRGKDTVAPFPDLNRESLAYVIDALVKKVEKKNIDNIEENPEFQKLLQGANFGKLYAWAIEKATPAQESELSNTSGEWIVYKKGTDYMPLVESLQGHGTGWCTAGETTAEQQLRAGDFHVYYSYDKDKKPTIPRIAIRMEEQKIAEVRGVAEEQNLDSFIAGSGVLDKKIKEFGKEGKLYEKKSSDMKRLTEIDKKEKEELSSEDLRFLYEIDSPIEGFGFRKDPRIKQILKNRDIKEDLSKATGFSKDEISINEEEALRGGIKYHHGNLNLENLTSADGLKLPESLNGNLNLQNLTSAEGLKLPKSIGGHLDFYSLTSAKGLELPESVGGHLDFYSLTSAKGLKLPKSVGGSINFRSLTSAEGLELPESVGGNINFRSLTSAEGLELPESVGGNINFRSLTSAKELKLPESVGGELDLHSLTSAEGLELPESVGERLDLYSLTSAKGLKLPKSIGGHLNLSSLTSAKELKLPESVGRGLMLRSLTSAEGLKLPKSVGGDLDLESLTSAEGLELPESVGGHLDLYSLTSAKGLKLPKSVGEDLDLHSLTSVEGLELPESVGRCLILRSLTSTEALKIPKLTASHVYFSENILDKDEIIKKYQHPRVLIIFSSYSY
jgi:hypothetical protein